MPTLFSKSCTYAIQATLFLSARKPACRVLLRDISRSLNIPQPFLSKVLQKLVHDGILSSYRGTTGGFGLARPAREISLQDIMSCIDGRSWQTDCLLGFKPCSSGEPCILHSGHATLKETVDAILLKHSVASIAKTAAHSYRNQKDLIRGSS